MSPSVKLIFVITPLVSKLNSISPPALIYPKNSFLLSGILGSIFAYSTNLISAISRFVQDIRKNVQNNIKIKVKINLFIVKRFYLTFSYKNIPQYG